MMMATMMEGGSGKKDSSRDPGKRTHSSRAYRCYDDDAGGVHRLSPALIGVMLLEDGSFHSSSFTHHVYTK